MHFASFGMHAESWISVLDPTPIASSFTPSPTPIWRKASITWNHTIAGGRCWCNTIVMSSQPQWWTLVWYQRPIRRAPTKSLGSSTLPTTAHTFFHSGMTWITTLILLCSATNMNKQCRHQPIRRPITSHMVISLWSEPRGDIPKALVTTATLYPDHDESDGYYFLRWLWD